MEQRPDSPDPVVLGAGTDPTYIPGLDVPGAEGPGTPPGEAARDGAREEEAAEAVRPGVADPAALDDEDAFAADAITAEDDAPGPADGEADDADDDAPAAGPSFEVSDRRGVIAAGAAGMTFRLDDTEARFRWDEIGAVEINVPRFGRRFAVTVYTRDRRHFDADVEAPARRLLREWEAELDAALDVWFDDARDQA
ncbi:hypothetical protein [Streptomyces sp. JJ36]|uniref:hypothetical protein n=1 Tax=Streptomyces sp. JJ36 TaxID=2736645 RepID=UPI001F48AB1D|nr:hypothetical protein [Streptomyces sp. JJ36]